jgi:multisubunit Na+/H+ antiporter MnhB subunit
MFLAHLHLYLNHGPAFGLAFGVLILLYGLIRRNCEVVRTSFLLFVLSAVLCVPVYLTGDFAERAVKGGIPDVPNDSLIKPHEESALISLIFVSITGAVALVAFYLLLKKKECPASVTISVLILALISLGFLIHTGDLGGKINHPELRPGYVMPPPSEDEED